MLGRFIFNRIGALVIGALFIVAALVFFSGADVKCGSDVMTPSDVCVETKNGKSSERTYDEQKQTNELSRNVGLGLGGVILIGGVIANVRHYTRKKPEAVETPAA